MSLPFLSFPVLTFRSRPPTAAHWRQVLGEGAAVDTGGADLSDLMAREYELEKAQAQAQAQPLPCPNAAMRCFKNTLHRWHAAHKKAESLKHTAPGPRVR